MPTDRAQGRVVVGAPFDVVMAVVRDVSTQPEWVPQIVAAHVISRYQDGTPATASFELSTRVGNDSFTLDFEHTDDAMSWVLVAGRLQKAQTGQYRLTDLGPGDGRTEVLLDLTVEHTLSAPGFVRRKVLGGFVDGAVQGLRGYVEGR